MRSAIVDELRAAGCVFAEDEASMLIATARSPTELDAMVERRVGGLPLELVLGWAAFRGLRIAVEPGVFVPRRRTEFLAESAAALARPGGVVVDLCCGTGAVGLAIAAVVDRVDLRAVDIDPAAVRCARRNIGDAGRVYEGDLFAPLPPTLRGTVDVLVANAPYVPTGELGLMPAEARLHESRVALDGGVDGLDVQRRVVAEAAAWLAPDGHLLIETSSRQSSATADACTRHGLRPRIVSDGNETTVVIGDLPARR